MSSSRPARVPRHLPGIEVDNKVICDNEGALCLRSARSGWA
jgi:hypothetical protein